MTGEQLYQAHVGTAAHLGIDVGMPPWEDLSLLEKTRWDQLSFEQDLRDRVPFDSLHDYETC